MRDLVAVLENIV